MPRNRCSLCPGIGARLAPESVLALPRNRCSACSGIGARFAPEYALHSVRTVIQYRGGLWHTRNGLGRKGDVRRLGRTGHPASSMRRGEISHIDAARMADGSGTGYRSVSALPIAGHTGRAAGSVAGRIHPGSDRSFGRALTQHVKCGAGSRTLSGSLLGLSGASMTGERGGINGFRSDSRQGVCKTSDAGRFRHL